MRSKHVASATGLALYQDRLARAQAELDRQGVDFLMVGISSDLYYLYGYEGHASERLTMLILPRSGKAAVVVPKLESPLLAERRDLADLLIWEETEAPTELAASFAGDASGKTVAVNDHLFSSFLLKLQAAMPGATWVSANDTLKALRMIKDTREVELLHEAGRRTDVAWEEFIKSPLSGQTEIEAMQRLVDLTTAQGLKVGFGICASGPNAASPHHHTGDRVIQQGDSVVFDWGGTLEGYTSDVTRTLHVGEPSEEFRTVYQIVLEANQAALDAVKPGAACQEIDRAARTVITDAGYGDAFLHRTGHGLGLDVHEEPYLVEGNSMPLAAGMVFSDEPGIYLAGRFGIRIEDAVVVTESGGMRLNEATRELVVVG
jgi:D-alanyl-D-alanine dipeptidase